MNELSSKNLVITGIESELYLEKNAPRNYSPKFLACALITSAMLHLVIVLYILPDVKTQHEHPEEISLRISLKKHIATGGLVEINHTNELINELTEITTSNLDKKRSTPETEDTSTASVTASSTDTKALKLSEPVLNTDSRSGSDLSLSGLHPDVDSFISSLESSTKENRVFSIDQHEHRLKQKYKSNYRFEAGKIHTFTDAYGSKVVAKGETCFEVSKDGVWSLPKKCHGVKNSSEKMADRISNALEQQRGR